MKILFLDIDGVMIPTYQYLKDKMCSYHRVFPDNTIITLNYLCEKTGLKVVFNTTHNNPFNGVPDIEIMMEQYGFNPDHYFYPDLKTDYPLVTRDMAVKMWLVRHPEVEEWYALDDAKFTDEDNLILIDPDDGLNLRHVNLILEKMNLPPCLILI